jgi:hypothetical protein
MRVPVVLAVLVLAAACTPSSPIASFEDCVAAGNPAMESYPRKCAEDGKTFVEEIEVPVEGIPAYIACGDERPRGCTEEYAPVCAFKDNGIRCITAPCASVDAVIKGNACTACSDETVQGHYAGSCENNRIVVCGESQTGFSKIAEESGWICVDTCPNNYDAYTTQIGAELCIAHYGEEEINSWDTCEQSSGTCDCVKAYETTSGELIEDAQFRCVAPQYAERLLFRGGQERLDENGKASDHSAR